MLWKYFSYYWNFYLEHRDKLAIRDDNKFVLKLMLSSFVPSGFLLFVFFIFRAPIMDFRPFKAKEKDSW